MRGTKTARPKRYPSPQQTGRLSLSQIAKQMGWRPSYTLRFIFRFRAVLPEPRRPKIGSSQRTTWPASIIEDLRRLHQLPYDEIDPQSDWLARYLKEGPNGPN